MKKNKKGQSIIEVIVALLLVSIVLTAVVGLITKGIANNTFDKNKTLANSYSTEVLEWLRSERDARWATFAQHASAGTTTWCVPSLSWTSPSHIGSCTNTDLIANTKYKRSVDLKLVNASTIDATVSVSWTDASGTHSTQSTTEFTNWKGNP